MLQRLKRMMGNFYKQAGFTATEMMVVVAIVGTLAAVGLPQLFKSLPNYRLRGAARELVSDFYKARFEAVKRSRQVVIQFTPGAYDAAGEVGGYIICVDEDKSGTCDAGEEAVPPEKTMPANVSLYTTAGAVEGITFIDNNTGFKSNGNALESGSVMIRNNRSRFYRVTLSAQGNATLTTSDTGVAGSWVK
ncbi:GspH/FimT family pseudopilin [Thiovibrio sp. JS02]